MEFTSFTIICHPANLNKPRWNKLWVSISVCLFTHSCREARVLAVSGESNRGCQDHARACGQVAGRRRTTASHPWRHCHRSPHSRSITFSSSRHKTAPARLWHQRNLMCFDTPQPQNDTRVISRPCYLSDIHWPWGQTVSSLLSAPAFSVSILLQGPADWRLCIPATVHRCLERSHKLLHLVVQTNIWIIWLSLPLCVILRTVLVKSKLLYTLWPKIKDLSSLFVCFMWSGWWKLHEAASPGLTTGIPAVFIGKG